MHHRHEAAANDDGWILGARNALLTMVGLLVLVGAVLPASGQESESTSPQRDRVADLVKALRTGDSEAVMSLRAELTSATDTEVEQLGRVLRESDHRGARSTVASLLADLRSEVADDALRASLFTNGERLQPVAAALARRRAWVSLTESERASIVLGAAEAPPVHLGIFLRLLVADRAVPDGGVSAVVTIVLDRLRDARSDEPRADRIGQGGATLFIVRDAAGALHARSEAAIEVLRKAAASRAKGSAWSETSKRFALLLRALLGDRDTAEEVIAAAIDPLHGVDAQILAILAIPRVAGKPGRPVLERIVRETESVVHAPALRTHATIPPPTRLRDAATQSLRELDEEREER